MSNFFFVYLKMMFNNSNRISKTAPQYIVFFNLVLSHNVITFQKSCSNSKPEVANSFTTLTVFFRDTEFKFIA